MRQKGLEEAVKEGREGSKDIWGVEEVSELEVGVTRVWNDNL